MKARHRIQLVSVFLLALLVLTVGFSPVFSATAQSETVIAVDPAVSSVPLGCQVRLELIVEDGLNVNAFDVQLQYDSDRLALSSWEHGDYLSNLTVVKEEDQPGFLWLVATQIATAAASGDGTLLVLNFDTLAVGTAQVEIEAAVFADSQGNKTYPDREPGDVLITSDPTYTVTSTMIHTPTATQTQEGTPKDTEIPTETSTPSFTPTLTYTTQPGPTYTRTPTRTRTIRGYAATRTATQTATSASKKSATPTDETREATNTPNEAYPVEVDDTATPASTLTPTTVADGGEAAIYEMDLIKTAIARGNEAGTMDEDSGASARVGRLIADLLLWVLLVIGSGSLVLMFIILIRRRRKNNDDKDLLL